jgi:PhnB protein
MQVPKGHQAVMPYLILNNAAGFIDFVKKVFNADLSFSRMREDNLTIMHSEVQISGSTIMFCDATEKYKSATANMFVYVDDADITFEKAIGAGSKVIMELADQAYGRSGGLSDPFGNEWWITSVKS